jgi:hypothetical protein
VRKVTEAPQKARRVGVYAVVKGRGRQVGGWAGVPAKLGSVLGASPQTPSGEKDGGPPNWMSALNGRKHTVRQKSGHVSEAVGVLTANTKTPQGKRVSISANLEGAHH